MATTAKIAKEAEEPEVQDSSAQSLQAVRAPAGLHAQVRAVPPVLPQGGARGRRHGRDEEQLVAKLITLVELGRVARVCDRAHNQLTNLADLTNPNNDKVH